MMVGLDWLGIVWVCCWTLGMGLMSGLGVMEKGLLNGLGVMAAWSFSFLSFASVHGRAFA